MFIFFYMLEFVDKEITVELKELRHQLQDLLSKGFIRPSVSP